MTHCNPATLASQLGADRRQCHVHNRGVQKCDARSQHGGQQNPARLRCSPGDGLVFGNRCSHTRRSAHPAEIGPSGTSRCDSRLAASAQSPSIRVPSNRDGSQISRIRRVECHRTPSDTVSSLAVEQTTTIRNSETRARLCTRLRKMPALPWWWYSLVPRKPLTTARPVRALANC